MMTLSASAAFIVTAVRQAGTNGNAGNDIIKFYAKFDAATSPEGLAGAIGLQSVKATLSTPDSNGFIFRMVNLDGSPVNEDTGTADPNDADVQLTQTPKNTTRSSVSTLIGTTIRAWDFNNADKGGILPNDADFTVAALLPSGNRNPNAGPPPAYTNLKSFRVEGALLNPQTDPTMPPVTQRVGADTNAKVANALTAADNVGAIFAIAVVKPGALVQADYILSPDQGPATTGTLINGVPEPATFGHFSVAGVGLLARRRRKA